METLPHIGLDLGARAYRILFEKSPLPMLLIDRGSHQILAANEAAARCYGRTTEQMLRLRLSELDHVEDWPSALAYFDLPAPLSKAFKNRWRHISLSGDVIDVIIDTEDAIVNGLSAMILSVRDVTREIQALLTDAAERKSFDETLQTIPDIFFTLDFNGRFTFLNSRAEKLFQSGREKLLGGFIGDCIPETWRAQHQKYFEEATQSNTNVIYSWPLASAGRWYEVRLCPIRGSVPVFIRDVTRKHLLDEKVRQANHYLHALTQVVNEAVISVNSDGEIQTFNLGAERTFGINASSAVGQPLENLLPLRFRDAHIRQRAEFSNSSGAPRMMGLRLVKGLRADGKEIDLEGNIAHVIVGHSLISLVALQDVTARLAVEVERRDTRTRLSNLARKLMLQEKELIKNVAQMLHDQLGQTLAAIRVVHEAIGATRSVKPTVETDRLDGKLAELINQAIGEVRMVLVKLHPPLLEEFGLAAALDNELRDRAMRSVKMRFALKAPNEVATIRWAAAIEYAAFMVAREAIENAIRHSGGDNLVVILDGDANRLSLDIVDNGKGFGMAQEAKVGHLGMAGIQERAKSIGATVIVVPVREGGTCVSLRWEDSQ